jgi:DNA-binding transcriptional LysR family regulator
MNLRFVEAFYWVAQLKSISRAAEKLFLTQSAMSSRIAALEEELGVLLLDRRDKQFRLTIPGLRFLNYAERLLTLQRDVKLEMGSGSPQALSVRIGAIESVLHSWLIPWVERLRAEHPVLELELTVETTPVLVEQVRRGTLDIAFAALPATSEGLKIRPLVPMEMVFVGNARLHRRQRYSLEELAEIDLLTFQRGSQPHVALMDLFRQARLEPRRVHAISSISAMTQLVEGGFGVATLPHSAAQRLLAHRNLRLLKCDVALQPLPVFASYRPDPGSPTVETVVQDMLAFVEPERSRAAPRVRKKAAATTAPATPGRPAASKKSMT